MGCCNSKLVEPSTRQLGSRAESNHASQHELHLARSSLALAALPLTRHGGGSTSGSSSSSALDSSGGYASRSDDEDSASSLTSAAPAAANPNGDCVSESGCGAGVSHQHRALASIKTTHKLRVGVLEGTTFLNQFIVINTLGRGSYGKVKLCLNTGDDTLYAVKVVNTRMLRAANKSRLRMRLGPSAGGGGATPSGAELPDLQREVEVMRSLDHPNLLRLFEVIDDKEGGKVLMVIEFAEGGAIVGRTTLTPERTLPEAMAQWYFKQMAAGLAYLHQNHVVHGDLKPENVMLCAGGTVKIGDFGQSQFFDRRDTFSRTLGTPAYLAPEICAGEAYHGRQADCWALGVSLYLFIYGELPFKGVSVLELYDSIAGGAVPYPRHRPVSPELQDIFLRLLHTDPRHRITAAEVMHHPWVSGTAWRSLLPDVPSGGGAAGLGGVLSAECQEYVGMLSHPLVGLSAEEVAAVVFPDMAQAHSPNQDSPTSPTSPGGGSTQLVDALAAAASTQLEDDVAARLAHSSPKMHLHQLTQDSMLRRDGAGSSAPSSCAAHAAGSSADDERSTAPDEAEGGSGGSGGLSGQQQQQQQQQPDQRHDQRQEQHGQGPTAALVDRAQPALPVEIGPSRHPSSSPQAGTGGSAPAASELGTSFGSVPSVPPSHRRASSLSAVRSFFSGPVDMMAGSPQAQDRDGTASSSPALTVQTAWRRPLPFAGVGDVLQETVPSPPLAPPRLSPRPALPRPTAQQPVVVNIFRPGERLGMASSANQQLTCFYIEQGVVEVRYEADVPITLSSVLSAATSIFRRHRAAAAAPAAPLSTVTPTPSSADDPSSPAGAPAAVAKAHSGLLAAAIHRQQQQGLAGGATSPAALGLPPPPQATAEDQADPLLHGPHVSDLGVPSEMERQGSQLMERSQSLAQTVAQATLRAKALLDAARAKGTSLDHLLVSERATGEFLDSLAMLDPHFLMGRWKATAVARTHVVALNMTRQGLEHFLQQHPLAQVHLRASMARARAEVVKLEALEKIAVARQRHAQVQVRSARTRSRRASGATTPLLGARPPLYRPASGTLVAPLRPFTPAQAAQQAEAAAAAQGQPGVELAAVPTEGVPAAAEPAPQQPALEDTGGAAAAAVLLEGVAQAEAPRSEVGSVAEAGVKTHKEGQEEEEGGGDAASLSTASSGSLDDVEGLLPPGAPGPRRRSSISCDDAFTSTLELFKVVSHLRDALSEQLRTTVEKRAASEGLTGLSLGLGLQGGGKAGALGPAGEADGLEPPAAQ